MRETSGSKRRGSVVLGMAVLASLLVGCVAPKAPTGRPKPLKIAFFGDSVAWSYWVDSTNTKAIQNGDIVQVEGSGRLGCGFGRYSYAVPNPGAPSKPPHPLCDWSKDVSYPELSHDAYRTIVARSRPDLALVWFCGWDVTPHWLPLPGGGWESTARSPGDPVYDEYLRSELRIMTTELLSAGAKAVVVLTCGRALMPETLQPRDYADALLVQNDLMRGIPALDSRVKLIDAQPWIDSMSEPYVLRHDGVHFKYGGATIMADWFTDPALLALRDQLWPA